MAAMKCVATFCLLALASGLTKETPIDKVLVLIKGLASKIEGDGKSEQESYDKYACWVESTMQRKASDITKAKDLIGELNDSVKKLKAEIASHGAEVAQLNKDLAQNAEANKDATGLRNKENAEYANERTESEQCIGALEAAVKVLTGAGTKKGAFLEQSVEFMSVAGGLRRVMQSRAASKMSETEASAMKRFIEDPSQFTQKGMIAAQTGQNPFGDYAPQSTQIQGILKGQYDAFTADLEKENAEEAKAQKSYEALMATKEQERKTLEATLQRQESDQASKTKQLSEDQVTRDDTTEQLAADETFFEETKEAAQNKATEWSVRTRLRVEELAGMQGAVEILSGGKKTFEESVNGPKSLMELKAVRRHTMSHQEAYGQLKTMAAKYQSSSLQRVMAALKSGGHFDKVMVMIDEMMALLRKEEQDDIAHRDRCENGENANSNQMEDLNSDIKKTDKKLTRMGNTDTALAGDLKEVEGQIAASEKDMQDMLDLRNKDHADFQRALQMDSQAVELIAAATVKISKYYKDNKIPLGLVQSPEYSEDEDKAPETTFSGGAAHQSESGGIVAILSMIKEDLQKEMKEGRADEAKAQGEYEKQNADLQASLDAQEASKVNIEKERADLAESMSSAEKFKNEKNDDLDSEADMKKSLATDCSWVQTHFDKRRNARKTEMDGLVDAKNFLAGVENGDAVLA